MSKFAKIIDIDSGFIQAEKYDLALFASGYESRCTFLAKRMESSNLRRIEVLGFRESLLSENRIKSDRYFTKTWNVAATVIGRFAEKEIGRILEEVRQQAGGKENEIRILVDYTSMSRLWYAAVLNWARFHSGRTTIFLDFNYSVGKYSPSYASELSNSIVEQIISLPAMEGLSASRDSSIAVLGLGFTPTAGLGVLERLQPQSIFSFYASPGARAEYAAICQKSNSKLIEISDKVLELPLGSVNRTFKDLCELLIPYLDSKQITFIPMGPKTHVLASMLVACRFKPVACLYANMRRRKVSDVEPARQQVISRVIFTP